MSQFPRSLVFAATFGLGLVLLLKLLSPGEFEPTPEYEAACIGPPLRTMERRYKAEEEGHFVNRQFDCIDKESHLAEARWRAESAAANTPEALARKREEFAAADAQRAEERQRREAEAAALEEATRPALVLRPLDLNSASEAALAEVFTIGPQTAREIIEERGKRRFSGWDDAVARVTGLSAAQTAYAASASGIVVDGRSLEGASMSAEITAAFYERRFARRPSVSFAP